MCLVVCDYTITITNRSDIVVSHLW